MGPVLLRKPILNVFCPDGVLGGLDLPGFSLALVLLQGKSPGKEVRLPYKLHPSIDIFHKWRPILDSFDSIKISLANLILKFIIQKSFYPETSLVTQI